MILIIIGDVNVDVVVVVVVVDIVVVDVHNGHAEKCQFPLEQILLNLPQMKRQLTLSIVAGQQPHDVIHHRKRVKATASLRIEGSHWGTYHAINLA